MIDWYGVIGTDVVFPKEWLDLEEIICLRLRTNHIDGDKFLLDKHTPKISHMHLYSSMINYSLKKCQAGISKNNQCKMVYCSYVP